MPVAQVGRRGRNFQRRFRHGATQDGGFSSIASTLGGGLFVGVPGAARFQSRADNLAQDADATGARAAILVTDLHDTAMVTAGDIFSI